MDKSVKVRFYREGESVLAVFPEHVEIHNGKRYNLCYARLGQHSISQREYHYRLKKPSKAEYAPLAVELMSIGYKLDIVNKD